MKRFSLYRIIDNISIMVTVPKAEQLGGTTIPEAGNVRGVSIPVTTQVYGTGIPGVPLEYQGAAMVAAVVAAIVIGTVVVKKLDKKEIFD